MTSHSESNKHIFELNNKQILVINTFWCIELKYFYFELPHWKISMTLLGKQLVKVFLLKQ